MRRWTITLVAIGIASLAVGCGGSEDPTTTPTTTTTSDDEPDRAKTPPVGNGRGGVELEEIGGFDQPVHVAADPGDPDALYVVEQCGRIQRIADGGGEPETVLDISDQVSCGGEQGLLSVAFEPRPSPAGRLYVYFTDSEGDERVVEYRRSGDGGAADPDSARELLHTEDFAANHNGGQLQFGPDDLLYIGTGDGGGAGDPERTAQDLSSPLGKLLRMDPRSDDEPEVVAHGLRNPWRFSFDPDTRDLWIGDVGQNALEEVDAVRFGELGRELDFGWSAYEGTERFNEDQEAPEMRPPVLEYGRDRGCSITGGYVVRDTSLRSLFGRYVYGDYCGGEVYSFTARRPGDPRPGLASDDDRALGVAVESLSSFGVDLDGRVYATSLDGPVYRLVPDRG